MVIKNFFMHHVLPLCWLLAFRMAVACGYLALPPSSWPGAAAAVSGRAVMRGRGLRRPAGRGPRGGASCLVVVGLVVLLLVYCSVVVCHAAPSLVLHSWLCTFYVPLGCTTPAYHISSLSLN